MTPDEVMAAAQELSSMTLQVTAIDIFPLPESRMSKTSSVILDIFTF